jgi:hypothetical protein
MSDPLKTLSDKLDTTLPELSRLDSYWHGDQPAAFLAPAAREALGNRLRVLSVNFPRLAVSSLAERLQVIGFRTDGPDSAPDEALWRLWRHNGMDDAAAQAHTDALVYGRSFVLVWAGPDGEPVVTVESPKQVAVMRDPATRKVTAALKRWVDVDRAYAVLFQPDRITRYVSAATIADATSMPATGWTITEEIANPLGVVPVVPLLNRGRLMDVDGVSEMADVLDLADALNKLVADMMVTSEFYARPRRWAIGLEIVEDDDGNAVKPFSAALDDVWQSESPETKFGQFDAARLDGYADAVALVTQQIGALAGLPPHYLGLHGDQPASADAIRSAEASLVARAYARQKTFGAAWADVARLMVAVQSGADPTGLDVEVMWANPETRTPSQTVDAIVKLKSIGLPLTFLLDELGLTPAQAQRVIADLDDEANRTAAINAAAFGVRL